MRIYFAGGESPNWRKKLIAWDVKAVSINFKHLVPRLPKTKPFLLAERLPEDVRAMVHFEVPEESPELVDVYLRFVEQNASRLDFAIEPDGVPADVLEQIRADSACLPIWRPESGHRALQRLSETYSGIAVLQSAWESDRPVSPRLNRIVQSEGTYLHGLGVSKAEILTTVAFGSVSTGSWMSASKYGETQVWDGSELRRFPATDKESRQRYRAHIAHSGLDLDKIEADDRDEVCKLAVWSWQQFEEWLSRRREVPTDVDVMRVVTGNDEESGVEDFAAPSDSTPTTTRSRSGTNVVTRPTRPLPILEQGRTEEAEPVLMVRKGTTRVCDNCSISNDCPEYQAGSSCAFDIPVEIKTKEQLMALLNGALEIQAQRMLFARFREDLEGSIDPVVSKEMDRLFALTTQYKDIVDNAETLKVQIEAKGQAGVLSRLFGSHVGEKARELPGGGLDALETDKLLLDAVEVPNTIDWSESSKS